MKYLLSLALCLVLFACNSQTKKAVKAQNSKIGTVDKTVEEWKSELNDLEFYVLREKGTERAFTGEFVNNKRVGIYTCRGCELPLFDSDTKFKSGTGWPSFYKPYNRDHITEDTDYDIGYPRTELTCTRCGGHLGHVFSDGPEPTGLRYCINSVSLLFEEKGKKSEE